MSRSGLQYLETTGIDPVTGLAVDVPTALNRTEKREVIAGGTITAGDVVAFDTGAADSARSLTVTQAGATANGNPLSCGVALSDAVAGDKFEIAVKGYVENVHCVGGTALGAPLTAGRGAGSVDTALATDIASAFGVTLEAEAGGTVDLILFGS